MLESSESPCPEKPRRRTQFKPGQSGNPLRRQKLKLEGGILFVCGDRAEGFSMRPREGRESGEQDLFRSRLDQVINMDHALVKLARTIDWRFLEEKFGAVYKDGPGQPPLPTRLMAG